ncbi:MAG: aminotransferase class IV family protein [Deltaproteobacteria bacterium]|nr:aminotransferase class IV family protein [Deltaproteobacteria bacterium]
MNALTSHEGAVCIDGVIYRPEEATVSVFDRGFLYGDSAFEVLRTYGRKPWCESDHLVRLQRSCEKLLIPLPVSLDQLSIETALAVEASGFSECYLRLVITRGEGPMGLDLALARNPSRMIYALPLQLPAPELYQHGAVVGLVHSGRVVDGVTPYGAKSSNYLTNMLALNQAKQRGCYEAIIVDHAGEIVEGSTSNVFLVCGGRLITPPVEAGILEGITRKQVISIAHAMNHPTLEAKIRPERLETCDEMFITSSIREIVPITRVDEITIADGRPGPITLRLLHAYRERANLGK